MPERPKRRKNKNKRKNKNNRTDDSNNSNDVKVSVEKNKDAESSKSNVCNEKDVIPSKSEESLIEPKDSQEENSDNCIKINFGVACNNNNTMNVSVAGSSSNTENSNKSLVEEVIEITEKSMQVSKNPNRSVSVSPGFLDKDDSLNSSAYTVESPEQSTKNIPKLVNTVKSKSLDNDDDALRIVEISQDITSRTEDDNSLAVINSSGLVSDVGSDVDWEKTDKFEEFTVPKLTELATGTLSITALPLNVAHCDETKSLTPEAEKSLRCYLKTLNLSTEPDINALEIKAEIEQLINREVRYRLRKKALADDFIPTRLGPPRVLDVIDEEGSSESSIASRRHSHMSEKKSDNEDLEDDVFESNNNRIGEKYNTKSVKMLTRPGFRRQIPQECVLVGAKIKEPEITEARGDWKLDTVEKMKGAELVYLTDSSSSTSSINDYGEETDDAEDTDVSVRIITPTIEVTDTESLLRKPFTSETIDIFEDHLTSTNLVKNDSVLGGHNNKEELQKNINDHEIVVLSTDNIQTNLYVKNLDELEQKEAIKNRVIDNDSEQPKDYDLEMKVLKCELNNAINNLIKEVVSDSDTPNENVKETFTRQDSSSSIGSSQCTAKYNPTYSSLNDISNILHDDTYDTSKVTESTLSSDITSHVKDVFESVTGPSVRNTIIAKQPSTLKDLCVKRISTLPYGYKILEELASVSKRLQNTTNLSKNSNENLKILPDTQKYINMPYFPLPDVSSIEAVALETKTKDAVPPPVQPRKSSLKKSHDEHWTGVPTNTEPVYVCLSPSQKMLMEKTKTVITKEDASQLVDMHKKYVERRGYNETSRKPNTNEQGHAKESPVIPFKSQTGSRLLALIRDPTVTNTINSSISKQHYRSVDNLEKYSTKNQFTKKLNDQLNSIGDFSSTFKPIPPPRPRKYSSSYYESDESDFTDNSFRSMKSERKYFHYSTGNLSKEIENDISSIQNMHRFYTNFRDQSMTENCPRRPSLPKDLCEQQMEYIRRKEKEVEAEIKRLEEKKTHFSAEKRRPRAPLLPDADVVKESVENKNTSKCYVSNTKDYSVSSQNISTNSKEKLSSAFSKSQEELLREKMYSEYVSRIAEREERKQHKVIKITNYPLKSAPKSSSKSMPMLDDLDSKVNNKIEKEFICKARERWNKLGIKDPETEDEKESSKDVYREPKVIEHKIKVIEGDQESDVKKLPSHLQDFVRFTAKSKDHEAEGSGESKSEPASSHVVVLCAVIILVLTVGKYFFRLFRSK